MTTSTPNLALVLYNSTTDSAEYFSNFRAVIAGTSLSSNFYKIDTAYGSMQTEIDDIQAGAYFTLASYISANYYEATVTGITAYNTGMKIILSLDTASAGTVTLNINSLGIKSVMKINTAGTPVNIAAGELMVGKYYFFAYDGTRWIWVDSTSADQLYVSGTSGNFLRVKSDNTIEDSGYTNTSFQAASTTIPNDGYIAGLGTWTYSSADSPTFVIATSVDNTGVIGLGYKIKLTQTTAKYFIVTAITSSLITVYGGTDYTLANAAITSPFFSPVKAPLGFPLDPLKWTVTTTSTSSCAIASPTAAAWHGNTALTPTAPNISIPIGAWNIEYGCTLDTTATTASVITVGSRVSLSTSATSESDASMSKSFASVFPIVTAGVMRFPFTLSPVKVLVLSSKTTYYLIVYANVAQITNLAIKGDLFTTIITAKCAYL